MVYIQDQNSQTPSLANPPVPMTPPGTRFTFPLQDIEYEARDMEEGGGERDNRTWWVKYQLHIN